MARMLSSSSGSATRSAGLSETVGAFYFVRVDTVGRVGEILVSITGSKGRLPLLLGEEELEAGYVFRVVSDTVSLYGL